MHKNNTFPCLSFIGFHPFISGLSASAPRSWYASLLGKLCCRYQPSRANWKIRLVTGMRHLPYEERQQRRWLRTDLITAFKIFKGILDIDLNLFFLPPAQCGLRGHPYKVLQFASHRRKRGSAFSVRVVKYWNKLQASVVTAPSVDVFKKRMEKV